MKKTFLMLLILAAGISAYSYYTFRTTEFIPEISTVAVTEGDIVDTVGATGALEAVTTVQVGSQVSGIIQELYVDYNSIVREGAVLMRLDPSLFQTQIEQARANLLRAEADTERLRVSVDHARIQLTRAKDLVRRELIPDTEFEAAQVNLRSAEAQLKSADAQVIQAQASLNQNEVNLEHTVIHAPIDGIVISRLVDMGQTVAASLQAPELFVIAADLTKMRVIANIDESDVGRIRPNQRVTFTVDAYPAEEFKGSVSQIRLEPVVQQNVVTYATVIDAPNPDLKLKPGMTATISLEIARRENVVRLPSAALRFRPSPEMFAVLNQLIPKELQLGGTAAAVDGPAPPGGSGFSDPRSPGRGEEFGGTGGGFGGRARDPERMRQFQERLAQMSPEERERVIAARRAARGGGGGGSARTDSGAPRRRANASSGPTVPTVDRGATTIDALFGPLPPTESTGRVWVIEDEQLQAVNVRLGVTDGTATELLGAAGPGVTIDTGMQLVTNISTPETRPDVPRGNSGSPLIPQMPFGRRR